MSVTDETLVTHLNLDPDVFTKAEEGDSVAQLKVGEACYYATRIKNNCYSAFKWIKLSAEQGNMEAQFKLANLYALGHGIDQNITYAHEWYAKSALQDYPKALARIHHLYEEDEKIHSRGELNSEEEGMNETKFKKEHNVRELNEYRLNLMQTKNLLSNTIDFFTKQFKSLRESKSDDKDTQHYLGFLYQHGYGIRKITKRAIECCSIATDQGHINAAYNLGYLYHNSHSIKFNYRHAFKNYKIAAEGGSSAAQNALGYFYEKGLIVEIDLPLALYWYTKAAEKNNKGAMLNLARMYRKGLVDDPDYIQSVKWYKIAAHQGSTAAKNCLFLLSQRRDMNDDALNSIGDVSDIKSFAKSGLCSKLRLDISKLSDSSEYKQLEKLASQASVGDGNAMLEIGFKYFDGTHFTQDKDTGFEWMKKAVRTGLVKAEFIVAKMYNEGVTDVVKQDYYDARAIYDLAAKKKDDVAQYQVGLMYYKGHGARKDALEASKWFTWSADKGNSDAQYMLGVLRYKGEGLRKNLIESFEWFTKSSMQKNPHACYYLGSIYWEGMTLEQTEALGPIKDIPKDKEKATNLYKYAAVHGDLNAQLLLAKMYEKENKYTEAFKYYYLAADKNGNPMAKYKIGWSYLYGRGVEENYIMAFKFLNKAAEDKYWDAECLFSVPMEGINSVTNLSNFLKMFKIISKEGIASLEYNIGYIYEKGHGNSYFRNHIYPDRQKAFHWYELAAKKNNPKALHRLAIMHQKGIYVRKDNSLAIDYFKKGAEMGNIDSIEVLASLYHHRLEVKKNYLEAFNLYYTAANSGNSHSRMILALVYGSMKNDKGVFTDEVSRIMIEQAAGVGNIVIQYHLGKYYHANGDMKSSVKWFTLAAQGKIADACYRLGMIYEEEEDTDYQKIIQLYEEAMNKNHDKATCRMAEMYHYGTGVQCDYSKAFQLYKKAATQGNRAARKMLNITRELNSIKNNEEIIYLLVPTLKEIEDALPMYENVASNDDIELQYKIGYYYESVLDVPDWIKAVKWYSNAASNNNPEATYRLGQIYANGLGISQDVPKAIEYLKKAKTLGSNSACFELGEIYSSMKGTEIDKLNAKRYYIEGAEKGSSDAQYALGKLYEEGVIVQRNLLESLKWYTRAYLQNNTNAATRIYKLDCETPYCGVFNSRIHRTLERYANHRLDSYSNEYFQFYGYVHYQLGLIYFYGIGTEINYKKAWCHFNTANQKYEREETLYFLTYAELEIVNSEIFCYRKKLAMASEAINDLNGKQLFDIGMTYYQGRSSTGIDSACIIQQNYENAYNFFNRSFEKGYVDSQRRLGDMYYSGCGVVLDKKKGFEFHIIVANSQNGSQNYQTGLYYFTHVPYPDAREIAFVYFSKAGSQGIFYLHDYSLDKYYSEESGLYYHHKAFEIHKEFSSIQNNDKNMDTGRRYYDDIKKSSDSNYTAAIAAIYIKKAHEQGDKSSQEYLKDMYYNGTGVERNLNKAIELYKKCAENQLSEENYNSGHDYYYGTENCKQNYTAAFIYFAKSIEQGNPTAKRYLGDMYYNGKYVEKNLEKAIDFYKEAAEIQTPDENYNCGYNYYVGKTDYTQNYTPAFIYFTKSSDQGNPASKSYLGDIYYNGKSIAIDQNKGIELYNDSAALQSSEENYNNGCDYYYGKKHRIKNYSAALIYFTKSSEQGKIEANRCLGDMYYNGENITKDQEKAIALYNNFAELQSAAENCVTGHKYYCGERDHIQSYLIAYIYFTKSSEHGDPVAKQYLGDMYFYGLGVKKNQEKAIMLHKSSALSQAAYKNSITGYEYYNGISQTEKNISIALIYFESAVDNGFISDLKYIGNIYYYGGEGLMQDTEKAIRLYNKLSSSMDPASNYFIGMEYIIGVKTKKNNSIGLIFLKAAADRQYIPARDYIRDHFDNNYSF